MNSAALTWYARGTVRWLKRNPLYLMSAACMAVGVRLYLVSPGSYAGDLGLILATLGILQAYKWTVTSILLLLHRSRRSPEDEPSLLLVAALFWTGPLAAVTELSARHAHQGLLAAVGVVAFALLELFVVRRALALRMSVAGRLLAAACLAVLVVAPWQLHVNTSAGTDELFLYLCWWLLAGVALLAIGTLRAHLPLAHTDDGPLAVGHVVRELTFVLSVLAATAAHLYAMNYAFVGHARLFYAAPLLLALTAVGFDGIARGGNRRRSLRIAFGCLPLLALLAALERFDPEVPVQALPIWLRDPLLTTLAGATVAWWFGAWRTKSSVLFHVGTLALACTAYRAVSTLVTVVPATDLPPATGFPSRDAATVALWLITAYLLASACVRRSRIEAVLGLAILQVATFASVWDETAAALFTIGVAACWSSLAALHLATTRPRLGTVLWPIAFMLIMGWCADFHEGLRLTARLHTAFVVGALLVFGQLWPSTRYCRVAAGVFVLNALFFAGRGIALGTLPARTVVVLSGFLLLIAGALVSWNKRALLRTIHGPQTPKLPDAPGVDG